MQRPHTIAVLGLLLSSAFTLPPTAAGPPAEPQTKLVPVNLARGKRAVASSEETGKGNLAANAVDGDPETRWCAAGPRAGEWWQVDLGRGETLTGCALEWESADAVYRYRVEGSADGKAWRLLAGGGGNARPGQNVHAFKASGVRFLRVTFQGSSTGSWASLREVSVFGDKLVPADPRTARSPADRLLREVKVPDGFDATLFAAPPMVNYPVAVAAAPDGTLYVSSDRNGSLDRGPNRGSIYRLRDRDGDGRADEVKRFVSNVNTPRGLVWDHDRLYLMHPPHLSAFIDRDGDGTADEEKVLVRNIGWTFKDRPGDHASNGVTLGIDGWLYLAIGDFGFMGAEGADGRKLRFRGGGVLRVRPDGTGLEVYDRGTRNSLEMALDPLLNGFTRDNTNDGDGWDTRLQYHTQLANHGYPSLFKHFADEIVPPLADYGGGSGVGTLYLSEPGFPEGFGDALYTADWGREWVYRHHLTPKGAGFAIDQKEFFRAPRVTDLDVDASSRLYVSSWRGAVFSYAGEDVGFIVRLTPRGYKPEPLPDFNKATGPELLRLLESPSQRRRLEAQRALLRRGLTAEAVSGLRRLAADPTKPLPCRVAAVFGLKQGLKAKATPLLLELTGDAGIREYALRALTDRLEEMDGVPAGPVLAGLKDASPRVRLQSAVSLARLGKAEHAPALVPLLADEEPRVAHTAVRALAGLKAIDACFVVVDQADVTRRDGALRVLRTLHEPAVVSGLIARLGKEKDGARRRGLLTALCRLYFREGEWKGESWGTRPDTSGPYYQPETWAESPKIAATLKEVVAKADAADVAFLAGELARHKVQIDGSDRILALAVRDPKLLPATVGLLARADRLPAGAVPLLVRSATEDGTTPAVRSQAVVALMKTDREDAFRAALAALPRLESAKAEREYHQARDAFLNAPKLDGGYHLFVTEAAKRTGRSSAWADAALLVLSNSKTASPEPRDVAAKALAAGWADPRRRAQVLTAVALAGYRPYEDRVRSALSDPDQAVAAAAKRAADTLHLDPHPVRLAGPLVETLKAEAVIDAVLAEKGDAKLGAQLFQKLTCANCHTVKADEPLRGPFLGAVAATYKRRDLAESVLLPSKTIAQGFVTNVFELKNGKTLTGFVTQESATRVKIRDGEGKEIEVRVADVEERSKSPVSVMPEGLVNKLSVKEFASLLDYLQSLAAK